MTVQRNAPTHIVPKAMCAYFENVIKLHGQGSLLQDAREDTPAGELVRQFLAQERRMRWVYSHGKWYSGTTIVDGPSPLLVLDPVVGSPTVDRPTVKYNHDKLITDKHHPRGVGETKTTKPSPTTGWVPKPPPPPPATPRKKTRTPRVEVTIDGKTYKMDATLAAWYQDLVRESRTLA